MRSVEGWIGKTDDTPAPPRVRVRVFERDQGCCRGPCGRKLRPGDAWQADHVVALINGGENRERNLQTLCEWCHKEKSGNDVAEKSEVYATRSRHLGIKKPRSILGWKKFDGTPVRATRER